MGPEDIALVRGSPEHRRRWMDVLVCRRHGDGMDLLKRYRRVLMQRNRWLKENRGGRSQDVYQVLTQQFVELWSHIILYRHQVIQECAPLAATHYSALSGGAERILMNYAAGVLIQEGMNVEELRAKLLRKMEGLQAFELNHGVSAAGAHKEDVELVFDHGHDLRTSGSQGQCRSAALSLGFTALDFTRQWTEGSTLLLLDDIFAELDSKRRQAVAAIIAQRRGQVWVALPRAEDLPFRGDGTVVMENGVVRSAV